MDLQTIRARLQSRDIFFADDRVLEKESVIGYEKVFKWKWMATQLNTFVVASDFREETVTPEIIESHLSEAFAYAKKNYDGWPRGFQSGLGVISLLLSENVDDGAVEYCRKLQSGKKWAGFTIPVAITSSTSKVYMFEKKPMWGRVFFPHFQELIKEITA